MTDKLIDYLAETHFVRLTLPLIRAAGYRGSYFGWRPASKRGPA